MYTLDSADISLYRGVSPDWIPEELKNWFTLHLSGCDKIGNRIQVRISLRHIRFFYYDHDYNDNDWNPEKTTKDDSYEREVGSISLVNPKDTGNDILDFPQNLSDLELFENLEKNADSTDDVDMKKEISFKGGFFENVRICNNNWAKRFYGFPFSDRLVKERAASYEEKARICFRDFLRYCLLCFIYEFEDRGKAFCGSTIYHEVHDKLRSSDVYNMLSAKLYYSLYLYDPLYCSRNQEKYTYYTKKFADCLMDKRLNKVISPDNYGVSGVEKRKKWIDWINRKWDWLIAKMSSDSSDRQGWFYNSEEELERILERNRQQGCKGGAKLKDELVLKIRRYMYSNHAIDRAMTTCCGKCVFWVAQVFMLLWSVAMVTSSMYLKSGEWNWFYEDYHFIIFGVIIVAFVSFSGVISGDLLNTFLPRIIVAEATAWLTVGFASIVLNGMPWIKVTDTILKTSIAVLIVVGALVLVKSKQHSPYYKRGENITKTLLIMNHSIFFALALGCIFRFFFYDNLLRTNLFLSELSCDEHFDAVKKHLQRLEDMEESINEYRYFARDYKFDDNEWEYNNAIIINIKRVSRETNISDFMAFACKLDTMDSKNGVEIVDNNLRLIDKITPNLKKEIRETKNHLTSNFEEAIQSWAIVNSKNSINYTKSEYVNNLIDDVEKQKCSILVGDKQLYPSLLVFHALIVLVLAFVTQLFISDKSITEPL